jgi:hypothetical protein
MQHSVYDLISNQFSRSLVAMKGVLNKASEHAKARKFDENHFLTLKLAPDMFDFKRQVQIATDNAKGAVARLTGKTAPVFDDTEKTLQELVQRIDKTIEFLSSAKPEDFKDYASKKASFPWRPGVYLTGEDYLVSHAIPNFYFHSATAYNLLRAAGVEIGKGNFLGEQKWNQE